MKKLILLITLTPLIFFSQKKDIPEKKLYKIFKSNYLESKLTENEVITTAKCIKEKRKLKYNEMFYFSDTPKQFVFIPEDEELERSTQRMEWLNDFQECFYKHFPNSDKEPF